MSLTETENNARIHEGQARKQRPGSLVAGQYYTVRTPENVGFEFELAGIGRRALAQTVDLVCMGLGGLIWGWLVLGVLQPILGGFAMGLFLIGVLVLQWGYGMGFEWRSDGQTPGKRLMGLRCLDASGRHLSFEQAAIRNLLRPLDLLPVFYLTGGLSALIDGRRRRLGDLAAGTIVVQSRAFRPPAFRFPVEELDLGVLNSIRFDTSARRASAPAREALFRLASRRDGLPEKVRARLFVELTQYFEATLGMTRPPHLSAERFMLHLAAVLSRSSSIHP